MRHHSAIRLTIAALVTATMVIGAPVSPKASAQTDRSSYERDTVSYAVDYELAPEEAARQLELIEEYGDAIASLASSSASVFAGAYVSHDPFELRVFVTNEPAAADARASLAQALGGAPVQVRVRQTPLSELERIGRTVLTRTQEEGIRVDPWVDERTGVVVIEVAHADAELVQSMVQEDNTKIVQVDRLAEASTSIYGGLLGSSCTTGFSVQQLYGSTQGILTAGHCNDTQTVSGTTQSMVAQVLYGPNDSQWNRRSGDSYPNTIFDGSSTRSITSTKSRDTILVGAYVCHYGRTSGYNCGEVQTKTFRGMPPVSSPTLTYIQAMDVSYPYKTLGEPGDSGGPWFLNSQAWGIHHGDSGPNIHGVNDGVFMSVSYLANMNVYVRTTP